MLVKIGSLLVVFVMIRNLQGVLDKFWRLQHILDKIWSLKKMLDKIWNLQGALDKDRSPYFVPNMQPGHFNQCPDTPWHATQYTRGGAFKATSFFNQSVTEEFLTFLDILQVFVKSAMEATKRLFWTPVLFG